VRNTALFRKSILLLFVCQDLRYFRLLSIRIAVVDGPRSAVGVTFLPRADPFVAYLPPIVVPEFTPRLVLGVAMHIGDLPTVRALDAVAGFGVLVRCSVHRLKGLSETESRRLFLQLSLESFVDPVPNGHDRPRNHTITVTFGRVESGGRAGPLLDFFRLDT